MSTNDVEPKEDMDDIVKLTEGFVEQMWSEIESVRKKASASPKEITLEVPLEEWNMKYAKREELIQHRIQDNKMVALLCNIRNETFSKDWQKFWLEVITAAFSKLGSFIIELPRSLERDMIDRLEPLGFKIDIDWDASYNCMCSGREICPYHKDFVYIITMPIYE